MLIYSKRKNNKGIEEKTCLTEFQDQLKCQTLSIGVIMQAYVTYVVFEETIMGLGSEERGKRKLH